jgi:hypothetical protein
MLPIRGFGLAVDSSQLGGISREEALEMIQEALAGSGGGGSGIPLLIPLAVPFSTLMSGFLSCCADNGIVTADAFPEAYEQLVVLKEAGEANIVTMAEYAAEMTGNGGICGRFALDEEMRTFRIPCAPGAFWRGVTAGLNVGQYQKNLASGVVLPSVATDYQMRMYGAVTDAGTVELAQLIAAMAGKLDTSVFEDFRAQLTAGSIGAAPMPTTASGVGQWKTVGSTSLPAGGTWAYLQFIGAGDNRVIGDGVKAGVAAGGTTLTGWVAGWYSRIGWRIA